MSNNRDAPQSTAEPPATNTTQHELALPGTEAQSTSPKLDATLNGLHEIHKNDRSNGEDLATEAGFTTRGNPGRSGEGADGKYAISGPSSNS